MSNTSVVRILVFYTYARRLVTVAGAAALHAS